MFLEAKIVVAYEEKGCILSTEVKNRRSEYSHNSSDDRIDDDAYRNREAST